MLGGNNVQWPALAPTAVFVLDRKTSELRSGRFNKLKGNRFKLIFYEGFFLIFVFVQVFHFEP